MSNTDHLELATKADIKAEIKDIEDRLECIEHDVRAIAESVGEISKHANEELKLLKADNKKLMDHWISSKFKL